MERALHFILFFTLRSVKLTGWLFFSGWLISANAQTISRAEYFFDTDPGTGNGTPIIVSPSNPITFTSTISTTGLLPGYHFLFIRTRSSDGYWSLFEPKQFFIQRSIIAAEYFFDTDPGTGLGTSLPISEFFDSGTFGSTINTTGLLPGNHFLFVRTRDESKHWSLHQPKEFFIRQSITAAEYFFDTDPGVGLGTSLGITPSLDQISFTSSISTSALAPGWHFLFVRTKNERGKWSLHQPVEFYIRIPVVAAEYFIDVDPGLGNGTILSITIPTDLVTINPSITTAVLPDGSHFLFVRTKDIFGKWSLYEPQQFIVDSALPIELTNFTATFVNQTSVKLNWTTFTEVNNDFFTVQHSIDGREFKAIATVKGAGTSTEKHLYEEIHNEAVWGINYYRLKQTDFDGQSSLSEVAAVTVLNSLAPTIYPNPISEEWFIDFTKSEKQESRLIEVFDLTGRKCFEQMVVGEPLIKLQRHDLSGGIYLLRISSTQGNLVIRKISFL
jgi:hypothetical protein